MSRSVCGNLLSAERQAELYGWNGCTAVKCRSALPAANQLGEPVKPLNVLVSHLLIELAHAGWL